MAKEIYLYSGVYDFVAENLITLMEESKGEEEIVIRINSPGGSVFSGWGIIAKMKEHEGTVKVKIDGVAASMAAYVAIFADEVETLDVSRILLHRADMYVNTPEQQTFLDSVNKDLRAKLTAKIDAAKLKELKGVTIEDLFSPESRIDVWLTAKEAKALGLVNKIVKLSPSEITAFSDVMKIAASADKSTETDNAKPENETNKVMTLEEIKAKHPDLYAQIMAEGKTTGTKEEQDRVRGWEAFRNIDADAVEKGIKSGKTITATDIAEFTAKALSPDTLKKLIAGNAPEVKTGEDTTVPKSEEDKEAVELEAQVRKSLGLKTKTA